MTVLPDGFRNSSRRWRGPGKGAATVNGNAAEAMATGEATVNGNAAEAMATGEAKVFCCGLSNVN